MATDIPVSTSALTLEVLRNSLEFIYMNFSSWGGGVGGLAVGLAG